MCKATFSKALKKLREDEEVIQDSRDRHYINTEEKSDDKLVETPNLLTVNQDFDTKIYDLISKFYSFNNLKKMEIDSDIKNLCEEFIRGMNADFLNPRFESKMNKLYNEEIISTIKSIIKTLKVEYLEDYDSLLENINEPLEILYFLEKSIQDQTKIFIRTKQDLHFSKKKINSLNKKVLDIFYEIFILNSEFILSVQDIKDFQINLEISYDPSSDSFFNLNFLSNNEKQMDNLKDLILEFNGIEESDKNKIIQKAIDDTKKLKEKAEKLSKFRNKFKSEIIQDLSLNETKAYKEHFTKKAYVAEYFKFKERLRSESSSKNLKEIYNNAIKRYKKNKETKKNLALIKNMLKKEVNKLSKDYFNKELQKLEEGKNYPELLKKLNQLLTKKHISDENKLDLLIKKAKLYSNKFKEFDKALEIIKKGLKINNEIIDFYLLKAIIQHKKENTLEGLETLDYAFKFDETNYRLFFQKSYLLYELGNINEAIKVLSKGIKLNKLNSIDPDGLRTLLEFKIFLYEEQKKYKEIIQVYDDELIPLYPNNQDYYKDKYLTLDENLHDYEKALQTLETYYKKFGGTPGYFVNKSRILCDKKGKYEEALKTVNEGLEKFESELNLYINKAIILNNIGDFEKSLEVINKAENLDENNQYNVELLGRKSLIYKNLGDLNKALEISKKALSIELNSIPVVINHMNILKKLNKGLDAVPVIIRVLNIMPESQELIYELTNLCIENEKLAPLRDALRIINKAHEKYLENIDIIMNKASLLYHLGEKDKALKNLEKAQKLEDKNSENFAKILGLKSVVFYEKGEIEKAIEINKKAYKLFPNHRATRKQREKYSKILEKINQKT
ncbi:MAG: hypothetical protein GF311_24775 [Candidatus Lokiarchaeota archaeon]|nr:hypothetical protein [Candidatus Lokiarchaeota archaeon]